MNYEVVFEFLIIYAPAFIANAIPVLIKGTYPIDLGRKFIDGRRILGDGKTFEGLVNGLIAGFYTSVTLYVVFDMLNLIVLGTISSLGALLGDMFGAFIKRRLSIPKGEPAPLLDQVDFVVGATIMLMITGYVVQPLTFILAVITSVVLHVVTNRIAYILGLKEVPW